MTEKSKGWTPERRAAQRERILKNKPWEKSTGPKTERGKRKVSLNSLKHGNYAKPVKMIRRYFRDCRLFLHDLDTAEQYIRDHLMRNKLKERTD